MRLDPGTQLGPYQVDALVGAGGMGEVYRARDTRLDRTVAIKVLQQQFGDDADRRRRFEQEARAVSSLTHPHICTLHDVGSAETPNGPIEYLVMEFVDGQSLAERLERGPLPLPQAIECATEIAGALAAAHDAGMVHRDLKPGNVMLTKSGVKLLDFGLAKLKAAPALAAGATVTYAPRTPATTPGMVLGTPQYMAPEQLEGKEVDARADLWALGCVVYEMTSGRRAFEGNGHASLIAAIMERDPPALAAVNPISPPALDHVVARCLAKRPDDRWQSARDVLHELRWIASTLSQPVAQHAAGRRSPRTLVFWAAIGVALLATTAVVTLGRRPALPSAPGALVRFAVTAPGGSTVINDTTTAAISPDGQRLAMILVDASGASRLWIRALDGLSADPLPGTENAYLPFWSADGRAIGFFADGKLRKIAVSGGTVETICEAPDARGGTWNADGTIVFAPAATGPLLRVPADGGQPIEIVTPDTAHSEKGLRFPAFLPDGRHFIYMSVPRRKDGLLDVYLSALDSKERTRIMSAGEMPVFAGRDSIVFALGDRLMTQAFDPAALRPTGNATAFAASPQRSTFDGAPAASASATGVLAHLPATATKADLVWLDRSGREVGKVPVPPAAYLNPLLSPDGRWLVVEQPSSPFLDLWLLDLERTVLTRLTFDGRAIPSTLAWSPDSSRVAYQYNAGEVFDIYEAQRGGTQPRPLVTSNVVFKSPNGWTRDGRYFLFCQIDGPSGWDLWLRPVDGKEPARPFLKTPLNEIAASVSPDGRWVAYVSDESGKPAVYVRAFPDGAEKYYVTDGTFVEWSANGRELLVWNLGQFLPIVGPLYSVDVETSPSLRFGSPRTLFTPRQDNVGITATRDFQRFLAAIPAQGAPPPSVIVEVNWAAALRSMRHVQ